MIIYSKLLHLFGYMNIILCTGLTIFYRIHPSAFNTGTTLNIISFLAGFFGFYVMLILLLIYRLLLKREFDKLITFNVYNIVAYVLFGTNLICALLFIPYNDIGSLTPYKIAATLALAMWLNITTITTTTNYLKGV